MNKQVLILSGSSRKGGTSNLLCDKFLRGALESGNQAEKIFLRAKKVAPSNAGYFCKNSGGKGIYETGKIERMPAMQEAYQMGKRC